MSVTILPTAKGRSPASAEAIAETMRRLKIEAQAHAREHSEMFDRAVVDLEVIAQDIAGGGEAYQAGVREVARRLAGELASARMQLEVLLGRRDL
ncbi:MAG TPA: hypothetical protein VKT30_04865 [Caulobacteraceae bacterium]|nr:hypothetical protein [Caulobacteraceae bacterium]